MRRIQISVEDANRLLVAEYDFKAILNICVTKNWTVDLLTIKEINHKSLYLSSGLLFELLAKYISVIKTWRIRYIVSMMITGSV
jgi:hypothetical protein